VRSVGFDDPVEVARRLDLEASALAAGVKGELAQLPAPLPSEPVLVALPLGIAPDTAEALEWLVHLATPVSVVIDGYNVTYLIDPEHFSSGDLRRQLVAGVGRLRRRSIAPHRIVVVFDSVEMEAGESEVAPGGVEVRFTAAHLIADDEIVALAAGTSGPVVVVSNDRELRDRAEAEGALTLWGTALAAWL
jgi:predicted RNA-binding protein with PIN domain